VNEAVTAALRIMRANARIALEYAARHPDWRQDRLVVDAIAKRVEEVAEAAKSRFPRSLRSDYADVPWDEMAGMRDRLAHDYANVDLDVLAEVVDDHLPRLIHAIDRILGA
jgi:uncharacterized protein with HEPN domain